MNQRCQYIIDNSVLMAEWNWEKNNELGLDPATITYSSRKEVWWRCKICNQPWQAKVSGRNIGRGCPVCSGQKLVAGINDLATVNPKLAAEWDYDNNVLTPQEVSARNNVSVAWVCSICGHRWKTLVSARNRGTGCPQCQKNFHTSFPEYIIYFYFKKVFADTVNGYKLKEKRKSKIIDIFIPSLNLAIEYDGGRWHKNIQTDMAKTKWLLEQGISLVRLRETTCPPLFDNSVQIPVEYNSSDYRYLEAGMSVLFDYIKETYDIAFSIIVDIDSDFSVILDSYETNKKEKSLSIANPELAEEWDYIKNSPLTPGKIIATSDKKCWWICKKCGYS